MLVVVEGNLEPRGAEDGYDYAFVVTFATAQACDAYSTTRVPPGVAVAIGPP